MPDMATGGHITKMLSRTGLGPAHDFGAADVMVDACCVRGLLFHRAGIWGGQTS
jgi:hypothetical protein